MSPLALYYAVSRAAAHGVSGLAPARDAILRKTRAQQRANGSFGNALLTALALSTLRNYEIHDAGVERAVAYLTATQQHRGAWPRYPFYGGPDPPNPHRLWWGAESMTTALCLEALAKSL